MRYVAAALLCAMGENEISAANMEKILSSVGVEADKERLSQVKQEQFNGGWTYEKKNLTLGCGRLQGQVHWGADCCRSPQAGQHG